MVFKTEMPVSQKEKAFINFVVEALVAADGPTWAEMGEQAAAQILDKYNISRKRKSRTA